MSKKLAHFEAFGYEPLRMKPVHFASGFFLAINDEFYVNELLNKVAVTKSNRGLVGSYAPEKVVQVLRQESRIANSIDQPRVELLRVLINGVVDNDDAMFPAFDEFSQKGNDYTFITKRVLNRANRTDGYAGYFVARVLAMSEQGNHVLEFAKSILNEKQGTIERLIHPLLDPIDDAEILEIEYKYENSYGVLEDSRLTNVANFMHKQTIALSHLCDNIEEFNKYRKIRYFVIGLLAWLMNYILVTSYRHTDKPFPFILVDCIGDKNSTIRTQSKHCYARLREKVRSTYIELADTNQFSSNPITNRIFARRGRENVSDFRFLEEHFRDLALRMGYTQPRAKRVREKHFEIHPDTLRVLMLSILNRNAKEENTFNEISTMLKTTWGMIFGADSSDSTDLKEQGYVGFDESDLQQNANAFANSLKNLNLAVEPSDGLILCSKDIGEMI